MMANGWTLFLTRRKWFVIAGWIIVLAMTLPLALNVTKHLTANGFNRPGTRATWATNQLSRLHPVQTPKPLLITGVSFHQVTLLAHREHIASQSLHRMSTNEALYLPAPKTSLAEVNAFTHLIRQHHGQWQEVTQDTAGKTVSHDSSKTLALSGILALPFLAVLLFFVYGSLAAITLPLIIAVMGSELALAVVSLIETHIQLSVFLTDIVSFLALGVGIDYALFISNRFRLALALGKNVPDAVHESMRHAGRSVFYSGIAVALAVAALLLGGDAYWRGLALGGAIAIASVLLATHTLLPAIMTVMGRHINWGSLKRVPQFGLWRRVGDFVTNQPVLSIVISVVLLLPLAVFGPQIRMQTPANLASMLPVTSPIRQAIHKEQQLLGPGSIAPLAVVINLPSSLSQQLSWTQISQLTYHLASLPGVKSVASPTQVGLTAQQLAFLFQHPSLQPPALKTALSNFTAPHSSHLVVLYVTATTGPDNPQTSDLVHHINQNLPKWLPAGTQAGVGGQVPILRSFNQLTKARMPLIIATALTVALVVLAVATGSVIQAVLGVLFDALVALATAGLLVLVVQQGHFGFEAQPLDSSITPLIFVLLFGLSMDYEVILLHRIQEPLKEGKSVRQAVRHGISTTGSMITGAGMIMVVVFLALLISPLQVMKTLAIGLSFAVLIDTWVVRSLLVPATITLLNTNAYWPWRVPISVSTNQEDSIPPSQYEEEE
ncbi:MMPL family transporter [Sulfobacillus thermosulfidooxidans]|uniref:MMPL family transporter n=1 Tax=Sulfobacillus thermosulfidooxidans TaxID=28034 RepID=UPI001FA734D4|nr:MMPL family transporter [Sulfobacillus thermosulfidooxidans]